MDGSNPPTGPKAYEKEVVELTHRIEFTFPAHHCSGDCTQTERQRQGNRNRRTGRRTDSHTWNRSTGDDWKRRTGKHETILQRVVENARPVAMERRWYQCCKTEMDVVVRCRKHTRIGNILYAVINSCRKKIHVTDTERVKKPTQKSEYIKSQQKTHHSVKIANAMYSI